MGKVFTILNLLTFDSTWRTATCAAVHGQTASIKNIVFAVDAPFLPPRAFGQRQRGADEYAS